ncbi:MAG: hypothetical protein H7222_09345 [Methylotenera sp.]|nr:hypothetical protein [Oligoflexia bacterium]
MSITACDTGGVNVPELPGVPTTGTPSGANPNPVTPAPVPAATPSPKPTVKPTPSPTVPVTPPNSAPHASCVSSDANKLCIGLKVVAYSDSSGLSVLNEVAAETLVQQMNAVWQTCNIGFQVDVYDSVDPTSSGLTYGAGSQSELNEIRDDFSTNSTMLVAITGPWTGSTIAWTSMPGGGPYGTIVEKDYGHNPYTVGHELGHYMGLYHINDNSNLMNPYIGTNTSALNSSQCNISRGTTLSYWSAMLRK